jgi:hypothetical protein
MEAAMAGPSGGVGNGSTRHWLAIGIILASIAGIVATGIVAIALATDRDQTSRLVFTSLLPLFGTWVGTVLAFYFARDNLQAAAETTLRLTQQRLQPTTPVQDVMIPRGKIVARKVQAGEDPQQISLRELYTTMQGNSLHRIPIVDASDAVLNVVHDSTISAFANKSNANPADATYAQTLGDLIQDPELGPLVKAIGFVGPQAMLRDARAAMRSIPNCNDVFVTANGQPTDPMIGWLTNTDLAGLAE